MPWNDCSFPLQAAHFWGIISLHGWPESLGLQPHSSFDSSGQAVTTQKCESFFPAPVAWVTSLTLRGWGLGWRQNLSPHCVSWQYQSNRVLAEFVFTPATWWPALINNLGIFFSRFFSSRIAGFKMEAKSSPRLAPVLRTNGKGGSEILQTRGNAADVSPRGTGQEDHVRSAHAPLPMSFLKCKSVAGRSVRGDTHTHT